jgi:hypothetical protein
MSTARTLSRAGSLLQGIWGGFGICGVTNNQCGSWLASDGGGSGDIDVGCAGLIAGKPAPTGIWAWCGFWFLRITTVGVSLLAMAVDQAKGMSTARTLSRAGSLLQGIWGGFGICGVTNSQCGSWLASDGGGSGDIDVGCAGLIAGKPAPTGIWAWCGFWFLRITTVGVSLLAMAVGQATGMSTG